MKWVLIAAVATAALALGSAASADDLLTLQPGAVNDDTYALWEVQQGLPDSVGAASQALHVHHMGAGAATAVLRGADGQPVSWLTSLQWERRSDSLCTQNEIRWTLAVTGKSGKSYLVRLGCAVQRHQPGSAEGWTMDVTDQSLLRARILLIGGKDALAGTIAGLSIVIDKARGDAWLDNIQVVTRSGYRTWTSAADNGYVAPKPYGLEQAAVDEAPLTQAEETPADELMASLTPEQWYDISDEAIAAASL